jgi:hypothetical protein
LTEILSEEFKGKRTSLDEFTKESFQKKPRSDTIAGTGQLSRKNSALFNNLGTVNIPQQIARKIVHLTQEGNKNFFVKIF